MPQLDIQTFISQYMWFFFCNFIIIYCLIYTKVIPNLHTRSFIINQLSAGCLAPSSTDGSGGNNNTLSLPTNFNPSIPAGQHGSFQLPISEAKILPDPIIKKEIQHKILFINFYAS